MSAVPKVSPAMVAWAERYSRRYLAKHFHRVCVHREGLPGVPMTGPLVIYMNHAAWWDPLVAFVFTRHFFPQRTFVGPIDAAALERYGILRKLGFFAVEQGTLRGAKQFLRTSEAVLAQPDGGLCLTPQGRFSDPRERPVRFQAGLGQLAKRAAGVTFLPLAVEYPFWEERTPELLSKFGEPLVADGAAPRSAEEWTRVLEDGLARTQDALAADSIARRTERFEIVTTGRAGVGGIYDLWRGLRAKFRGEKFDARHSDL